jgi:diguanylate cyclase (GGDEF)-like protein
MAERWRASVESTSFRAPDGRPIRATLSMGIAEYAKSYSQADELIACADKALYVAKQKGRNRIEVFSADEEYKTPGEK